VPCGIAGHGVTSLVDLGLPVTWDEAAAAMKPAFENAFGRQTAAATTVV
jgi:lipoyl(octanoyl) transferase